MTTITDWNAEKAKLGALNWLVKCATDRLVSFQMDRTTVEPANISIKSKKGEFDIDSFDVDMWDIEQTISTGRGKSSQKKDIVIAENGRYVIPFWAKESFVDLMQHCIDDALPADISVSYVRTEDEEGLNSGLFEIA